MDVSKMIDEAQSERRALAKRIIKLDELIATLASYNNDEDWDEDEDAVAEAALSSFSAPRYPRPREAVVAALPHFAGKHFEPKDVTAKVRDIGLFNVALKSGAVAYSTALSRMLEEPFPGLSRDWAGVYAYAPEDS